jgi:RimJ/RimL family protein N-acetyltransferase
MLDPKFNAVIVVTPEHASRYRDIRLRGLLEHPEAFGEAARSFAEKSLETIQNQIETGIRTGSFILAAVTSDASMLGVVGLAVSDADKTRHRGLLWGMYVVPEARERGIGAQLLENLLQRAEQIEQLEQIHLAVVTTNRAAIQLYKRLGFTAYGTDPRVIKIDGSYFDEYLMVRGLRGALDVHPAYSKKSL